MHCCQATESLNMFMLIQLFLVSSANLMISSAIQRLYECRYLGCSTDDFPENFIVKSLSHLDVSFLGTALQRKHRSPGWF